MNNHPFHIATPLMFALFFVGYFLIAGSLYLFFKNTKKQCVYKIQGGNLKKSILKSEIRYSVLSASIFVMLGVITYQLYLGGYTQIYNAINIYGIPYLPVSFLLAILLHDFYFYWTHRLLHIPFFFRLIHKRHHLSHQPNCFSAFSFHPVEAFIQAAIIPIVVLLIPIHPTVLYVFIFYGVFVNLLGHSGYEFFPRKFKNHLAGAISNTPVFHDMHHHFVNSNYGLYLNIWDKIMGTYNRKTDQLFHSIRTKKIKP